MADHDEEPDVNDPYLDEFISMAEDQEQQSFEDIPPPADVRDAMVTFLKSRFAEVIFKDGMQAGATYDEVQVAILELFVGVTEVTLNIERHPMGEIEWEIRRASSAALANAAREAVLQIPPPLRITGNEEKETKH